MIENCAKDLIVVRTPATSANLGSGFDAMGMALSLYNIFKVTEILPKGEYKIETLGEGARELGTPDNNLVIKAYEKACKTWNVDCPGFTMWCHNIIPLCRGLGSSAGAVVAGVMIAKEITGYNADEAEMLRVMTILEGHPDNVAPCYLGGMVVSCWDKKELHYIRLSPLPHELQCVVAVPDERVSTEKARKALPQQVDFKDAVFNLGRSAFLAAVWATGRWEYLRKGMDDKLHQPYRKKLFSGGEEIFERVKALPECLAVAISGSGSSVITIVRGATQRVAETMCKTFMEHDVTSQFFVLENTDRAASIKVDKEALQEALKGGAK